jgi:hypothetical protein
MKANSNLGPLADELGEVRAQIAELKEREQELRSEILDVGEDRIRGERFTVGVQRREMMRLDIALIREKMGEEWVAKHSKPIKTTIVKVAARPKQSKDDNDAMTSSIAKSEFTTTETETEKE